jgi:hypothetical protein
MWEASIDDQLLATYATIDFHRCEYSRNKRHLSKQAGTLNVVLVAKCKTPLFLIQSRKLSSHSAEWQH